MTAVSAFYRKVSGRSYDARLIGRVIALGILLGLVLGNVLPAQAQTGDLTAAIDGIVTAITDIIQGVAIAAGIAGLSIWGFAKVARPVFPQISQIASNYIPDLLVGVAVVYVASTVVEALAGALSA